MINKILASVISVLLLVGCAPLKNIEQPNVEAFITLNNDGSIGQSFVAWYDGLQGINIFIKSVSPSPVGSIHLKLYSDSQTTDVINSAEIPLSQIDHDGFYRFRFDQPQSSTGQYYYLSLKQNSPADIQIGVANWSQYLNGSLYRDRAAQDSQLAFSLIFDPRAASLGLIEEAIRWSGIILLAAWLFILPGWVLLGNTLPGWRQLHWAEKAALGSSINLAIYPILYLWAHVFKLSLGTVFAWAPAGIATLVSIASIARQLPSISLAAWRARLSHQSPSSLWGNSLLIVLVFLLISTRFWAIRTIELPLWGDSYQHTVITQLLIDNNGLFNSWEPYAEIVSFTYHFGFHSLSAVFSTISGLPAPQAVLWMGQIINILAVLSLIPLAMLLKRSAWSGAAVIFLAGLLIPTPMNYVNWGRYTQLTGQVILPAVLWLGWYTLQGKKPRIGLIALSWLALCGLALSHYRVLIFALCGYLALWVIYLPSRRLKHNTTTIMLIGLGALILFLPWLINMNQGNLPAIISTNIQKTVGMTGTEAQASNQDGALTQYLPTWTWMVFIFTTGISLWLRDTSALVVVIWWFLVYLAANPYLLGMPGTRLITNFAVYIGAYIPTGILISARSGWLIESIVARLARRSAQAPRYSQLVSHGAYITIFIAACFVAVLGARTRLNDIKVPLHALSLRPDQRASAWINDNLPADARFLVNTFFADSFGTVVGSDSGWWLPILADRTTMLPPLQYIAEQGVTPDYRKWVNALPALISTKGIAHPEVMQAMQARGITHAYIGQRRGSVNSPGPSLRPEELLANPNFKPVYHQDLVWIFEIKYASTP